MTPLRKDGDGNLLKNADGDLVRLCGGEEPENTCNGCDPAIPDVLYVTLAGLAGVFAFLNGTRAVSWTHGCTWRSEAEEDPPDVGWGSWMQLKYIVASGRWQVLIGSVVCGYRWRSDDPQDDCDPASLSYSEHPSACVGLECLDDCAASAGATCSVSEVAP